MINIRRMAAIRCQNIWRLTKAMKDRPRLFDELRRDKAELRAKQEFMYVALPPSKRNQTKTENYQSTVTGLHERYKSTGEPR